MKWHQPRSDVYWFTLKTPKITKLDRDLDLDVAIIGGGVAGLMCAQRIKKHNKNIRVAVIESSVCGAGASGKGAGFVTPQSELGLADLVSTYGDANGRQVWEFAKSGIESIRQTIEKRNINCDYVVQDSLFTATDHKYYPRIAKEWAIHKKLGYEAWLYRRDTINRVIGSREYDAGVRYKGSFAINGFLFCQELKESLIRDSVEIYEHTSVVELAAPYIRTENYTIQAEKIIICTDRFLPRFHMAEESIHHAQSFLGISAPVPRDTIIKLFPGGSMIARDNTLFPYSFRLVQGNRLLITTSSMLYRYARQKKQVPQHIINNMYKYLDQKFPDISIKLEYVWPALTGVTKDFLPILGLDPVMRNVYFAGAGGGLATAAALGEYLADKILEGRHEMDDNFSSQRKFFIRGKIQALLSKPLAFAITHGIKRYLQ